ncbi:MAG: caspase family protein [Alistipes sp.]|nr:caspase family protein [Alistipes sp.]
MKRLFLICLLCLTAFEVIAQTANVYIIRKSLLGAAFKLPIAVNDVQIGKLASRKYILCTVPAGQITISIVVKNSDKVTLNAVPGQDYYILTNTTHPTVVQVNAVEGMEMVNKLKLDQALALGSNGEVLPATSPSQMGGLQPVYANAQPAPQPVYQQPAQQAVYSAPNGTYSSSNFANLRQRYNETEYTFNMLFSRKSTFTKQQQYQMDFIRYNLLMVGKKINNIIEREQKGKPVDAQISEANYTLSSVDSEILKQLGYQVVHSDTTDAPAMAAQSVQQPVYQQPVPQPVQQPAYQQPAYQQQQAPQPMYQQPAQQPQMAAQAGRNSDVDINVPVTGKKAPNTFVLIIANENYEFVDDVQYAINDGEAFREYCIKTLGVPERQVWFYKDASAGIISGGVDKMMQAMNIFNNAKAIVYYCGHGIPDEKTGDAYLVPTDGRGTNVATCYSLNKLYKTLSSNPSTQVTYFMDACFTGANRNGSMLVAARGVAREAKKEVVKGNTVVFSAASGDETAMPFKEKQHGLFTYFLLKKLQESKGEISYGDLADYIRDNVKKEAFLTNEKPQNPVVATSEASVATWRNYKM